MTTLLIDADILMYRCAFNRETAEEIDGYWTWKCDLEQVKDDIDESVEYLQDRLGAGEFVLCLSDTVNFRHSVEPSYKGNRSWIKRPVVLKPLREFLISERAAVVYPELEGDDVLGILQTSDTIIVSADKDMNQIEGRYYRSADDGMVEISADQARYYHLLQTMTGDAVDGYKGAKGIGAVTAKKILDKDCSWESVVETYLKVGQTEEEALVQARLAKILTKDWYDFENKKPIMWTP